MTELRLRQSERRPRPLVAVICAIPLVGEAAMAALDFAEVRSFSKHGGDTAGLLDCLRPDAVVVDCEDGAVDAMPHASRRDIPVVHISIPERQLHLLHKGEWHQVLDGEGLTPEVLRNVVAGALFARERVPVP